MKIRLLGTGAADGIPGMFSKDRVSNYAREHGGKDIRTRSAAIVDGCLKIDLPPETLMQLQRDGTSALDWCALLLTHNHADHFALEEIQYALYPFTDLDQLPFTIYANETMCEAIEYEYPEWPMDVMRLRSFEPVSFCAYRVTPIHAYHDLEQDSHNFIIESEGKSLLYATDTGMWREETWEFLKGQKLDGLVLECTEGFVPTEYWGHLDIKDCIEVVNRLREMGTLAEKGPVYTTHHSHNGNGTHAELEEALNPHGISPGWDGCEFEI
ncbi:MAG: hypothetical protein KF784_07745 [Fimbriimonadaceae bacterium]|nr:hypothetical protein [Fimbriimonadaceae bacterium]